MALPFTSKDAVSYFKVDAFHTQSHLVFDEKLKLVWQLSGGILRPLGQNPRSAVNDRFFITHALGYTHLGHSFPCAMPPSVIQDSFNINPVSEESEREEEQ